MDGFKQYEEGDSCTHTLYQNHLLNYFHTLTGTIVSHTPSKTSTRQSESIECPFPFPLPLPFPFPFPSPPKLCRPTVVIWWISVSPFWCSCGGSVDHLNISLARQLYSRSRPPQNLLRTLGEYYSAWGCGVQNLVPSVIDSTGRRAAASNIISPTFPQSFLSPIIGVSIDQYHTLHIWSFVSSVK